MIRSFIKPRNTFMSVAKEIGKGLENETVFLNDKNLIDAGYEILEFDEELGDFDIRIENLSRFLPFGGVLLTIVFALMILTITDHSAFILSYSVFMLAAWLTTLSGKLRAPWLHGMKRRIITKKSNGAR